MSEYRRHTWADGEVITAEKLNNIEEGITEAKKGAENIDMKVDRTDIVNNLDTDAPDKPLSAAQGVVLSDMIAEVSAVFSSASKIETGSYVGTGVSGQDKPNTLTFDFPPKIVIVDTTIFIRGKLEGYTNGGTGGSGGFYIANWNGNTLSWYARNGRWYGQNANSDPHSESSGAGYQLNTADKTFWYVAIA